MASAEPHSLLFSVGVVEPLMRELKFAPELRLVCVAWREFFDETVRRSERPFSRWIKNEEELGEAREAGVFGRCRVRVMGFVPRKLEGVHEFFLSHSNVDDVSRLGCVHALVLCGCANVTDVSKLGRVHTLDLSWCRGVTDVSALGRVHTLVLRYCRGIVDVSALGRVHTLDLGWCQGVKDVSALGLVHRLDLRWCTGVTDVSALGRVHKLFLSGCTGVTDFSALSNVKVLHRRKTD